MKKASSNRLISIRKVEWLKPGEGIAASGRIPYDLELFQDHFPAYPIFPGVLVLEIFTSVVHHYCRRVRGEDVALLVQSVMSVKFSRFLKPGDIWESHLKLLKETDSRMHWKAELRQNNKRAVSARLDLIAHLDNRV